MTETNAVVEGLLRELAKEENALVEADSVLSEAKVRFSVASRKYAAVRDLLIEDMGYDPYAKGSGYGRIALALLGDPVRRGKFRFIHMQIGDAVVNVLRGTEKPLTLEQIVAMLREGGIGRSESALTRAVNAALMRTGGVAKTDDGKYTYEEEEEE